MKRKPSKKHGAPVKASTAPFAFETRDINLDRLLLDPNNYRFLDRKKFKKKVTTRFHEESVQRATLDMLEQSYQLEELKQSILVNGYVPMNVLSWCRMRRKTVGSLLSRVTVGWHR